MGGAAIDAPAEDGIALIDKAAGWTSHDVVAKARRLLGRRKVGHAGTLDPDATGLLILGIGRATRLLRYVSGLDKAYTGEAVLGVATSTLDASGEVVATWDMNGITLEQVQAAARSLTGTIRQVPPMVSAKQIEGRRLYELARHGVDVDREAVEVRVTRFDVAEAGTWGRASGQRVVAVAVTCSSGTYVRALVADLGRLLGGGAHLRNLRRCSVGRFDVEEAIPIDELTSGRLLPPSAAFRGHEPVTVDDDLVAAVGHGQVLPVHVVVGAQTARPSGPWPIVDAAGTLLAVYVPHRPGTIKPEVVLVGGDSGG